MPAVPQLARWPTESVNGDVGAERYTEGVPGEL
jgi:hypothetical protein